MILTVREVVEEVDSTIPPEVTPVIKEFSDVFPEALPNKLPPMRDIQHIDLIQEQVLSTCRITEWIP